VRNAVDDTYGTTLRGPEGLAANRTLVLPDAGFLIMLNSAARLIVARTEYFMPLGSGTSRATSSSLSSAFIVPVDVEVGKCIIRCENAAGRDNGEAKRERVNSGNTNPVTICGHCISCGL